MKYLSDIVGINCMGLHSWLQLDGSSNTVVNNLSYDCY